MKLLVYLACRAALGAVAALPMGLAHRLGGLAGWLVYATAWRYRRLVARNLRIAFAGEKSDPELRALARAHFVTLGANLFAGVKATTLDVAGLRRMVATENVEILQGALDAGRGVVLVISHLGNWELFAQLCQFLPGYRWGAVYQPLANRRLEAWVRRLRAARGVRLFSRKDGFQAPMGFLRDGGAVGVLVDQHAGDGGLMAPFFGRLASTSTLAPLLALRTGAPLIPVAVQTAGIARWRVIVSPPIPYAADEPVASLAVRINETVAGQIRASPADWFWVHDRWKAPVPEFLGIGRGRGIAWPTAGELKPFRTLVRATSRSGDLARSVPFVQSLARARPDAQVTVLAPHPLATQWRAAPGVHAVISLDPGSSLGGAVRAIRRAGDFDAGVILPNSLRSALEMFLAGVPLRAGYAGHHRRRLLNCVIRPATGPEWNAGANRWIREALRYARFARTLGADAPPKGARRAVEISLAQALADGWLEAGFRADGRSVIHAEFTNRHDRPLRVWVPAGSWLETADRQGRMAVARSAPASVPVNGGAAVRLAGVATASANPPGELAYHLSAATFPPLDALLEKVELAGSIPDRALQTAVLILIEDAPLSLFADLPGGDGGPPSGSGEFQVSAAEIIAALELLKKAGPANRDFAAMRDSRLKLAALIDPQAHAAALKYFRMTRVAEWNFWCDELEWGKRSTRHYALSGIGRYHPDAALQMMPDWARARHLSLVYRAGAVQALAETRRSEAAPVLRDLLREFGADSALGATVREAMAKLEALVPG